MSARACARQVLTSFFELLPQAEQQGVVLPPQLANVDQLRVLLDALPDYYQAAPLGRRRTRLASAGTAPRERAPWLLRGLRPLLRALGGRRCSICNNMGAAAAAWTLAAAAAARLRPYAQDEDAAAPLRSPPRRTTGSRRTC